MGQKRYVQHISGQGERWELDGGTSNEYETEADWCIKGKTPGMRHFVPKSEYRLCDPPEQWENVTHECRFDAEKKQLMHEAPGKARVVVMGYAGSCTLMWEGYRLCKVVLRTDVIDYKQELVPAFIVERKVSH